MAALNCGTQDYSLASRDPLMPAISENPPWTLS
ncbi:hypothetical protein TMEN_2049 [Trichophyton mentagrophytes]|nr:hypothetical protein TMEN_2049 [Trichophyton mentagrophytes]